METLSSLFVSLDKKIPIAWIVLIFLVLLFIETRGIRKELEHVNKTLNNHITDTNKRIDRLSDRLDKQSEQFARLYELLLKEHKKP